MRPAFHLGNGFKAAMSVLWKATDIISRIVRGDFINHQERVEYLVQPLASQAMNC
jgi:hypothetical protein